MRITIEEDEKIVAYLKSERVVNFFGEMKGGRCNIFGYNAGSYNDIKADYGYKIDKPFYDSNDFQINFYKPNVQYKDLEKVCSNVSQIIKLFNEFLDENGD